MRDQASQGGQTVGSTVLVVDDDSSVRDSLGTLLESLGYRVLTASSAIEAVSVLDNESIDGFLLDIDLNGDTDGIELCRIIRGRDEHHFSPILFVSGGGEKQHLNAALDAGGDDFIAKPLDAALVELRLRRQLQRADYFRQLEDSRRMLRRYVSDATSKIVETTISRGGAAEPEARDVSICFTDIRGFTALSEILDPLTLFTALNDHLSRQIEHVHRFGGYIDKFSGDGLMAVFEGDGHQVQSCLCALGVVQGALRSAQLGPDTIRHLGIGIHTGRAIVGNLGPSERLEYTAIGTTVNLAARLCGAANPMSIVVSSNVRDAAKSHPELRFDDERQVAIRGLKNPVTVYTLNRDGGTVDA